MPLAGVWLYGCVVTSNAHEVLFRCNHLGCITMMLVASCIPFPLFHFVQWYACHACLCHPLALYASLHTCLHVHAWFLLASVLSMLQHNEVMDIRFKPTFVPCGHHLLFVFLLVCLLSYYACPVYHVHLFYSFSYTLCIFFFHCLSAGFLSLPLHVHTWSEDAWS